MSKVFLSHSGADNALTDKIAQQLGKNNCHYDSLIFEVAAKTIDEIFKGLEDNNIFV